MRLLVATLAWFAVLVLFNAPHLAANAALHWDSTASIATNAPMPTAAQLAAARGHVFDVAADAHSDDPAVVTAYFLSPAAAGRHGPLETVRRYYSQLSYTVARAAFAAGGAVTGSPTGGVVAFQLAAALLIAIALGALTAHAGTRPLTLLAFAALATSPVFLSISRQVLTETVGYPLMVVGLLLSVRRRWWSAAVSAACLLLAVRARYNLMPAIAVLLPLVWLLDRRRPRGLDLVIGSATFALCVALCVAIDAAVYGPWFSPWAYREALVRSTRLYFHTDPPYDAFWTAMYVNAPLLLLPLLGLASAWIAPPVDPAPSAARGFADQGPSSIEPGVPAVRSPSDRPPLLYATAVLLLLAVPLYATAAQQVSYQPRHLFPFTGLAATVLMLTINRIRWRRTTATVFAAACVLTIAANAYSTLGPQRTTMRVPWPPTITQTLRHRWTTLGPHTPWPLVLLNGYYDWSDNRRVHDPLLALQYEQRTPGDPLLIVSGGVAGSGCYCRWATLYAPPVIWWPPAGTGDAKTVDAALARGRPVLAVLPIGGLLPGYATTPTDVPLDQVQLVRVTAAQPPAAAAVPAADPLAPGSARGVRPTPGRARG